MAVHPIWIEPEERPRQFPVSGWGVCVRRITLFPYADSNRCRAYVEPGNVAGEAWPVRRFAENGHDVLEAVVILPEEEATWTYAFIHDGTNWISESAPVAHVEVMDLFV